MFLYVFQHDGDDATPAGCRVCLAGIPCVQYPAQGQDSHTHHQLLEFLSVKSCQVNNAFSGRFCVCANNSWN